MGTDVKLLFKQLESRSALRAFPHFPHRPLVVAVISGNRLLLHALPVNAFIPAPLRSGNYVCTSLRTPTLHYACIPASTSAPRSISIPLLTSYIPFPQSYPCPFPRISSGCLRSCGEFTPTKIILWVFVWIGFFFQKDSKNKYKTNTKSNPKRQIQQGLFGYNIYRQKNKKSSKDKAANTNPRFGQ